MEPVPEGTIPTHGVMEIWRNGSEGRTDFCFSALYGGRYREAQRRDNPDELAFERISIESYTDTSIQAEDGVPKLAERAWRMLLESFRPEERAVFDELIFQQMVCQLATFDMTDYMLSSVGQRVRALCPHGKSAGCAECRLERNRSILGQSN